MMCVLKQVTNGCIFEEDVVEFLNSLTEEGVKSCVLCSDEAVRGEQAFRSCSHALFC